MSIIWPTGIAITLAASLLALTRPVSAQDYPTRYVRIITAGAGDVP